ncbi:MAG: hypothetical protein SNF33_02505 [Candidatus Algichlamydia australiensis]|nr:hypothetical protein [Chlamydiales bacterium]
MSVQIRAFGPQERVDVLRTAFPKSRELSQGVSAINLADDWLSNPDKYDPNDHIHVCIGESYTGCILQSLMRRPVKHSSCGNRFEHAFLKRALDTDRRKLCPMCRTPITSMPDVDVQLQGEIAQFSTKLLRRVYAYIEALEEQRQEERPEWRAAQLQIQPLRLRRARVNPQAEAIAALYREVIDEILEENPFPTEFEERDLNSKIFVIDDLNRTDWGKIRKFSIAGFVGGAALGGAAACYFYPPSTPKCAAKGAAVGAIAGGAAGAGYAKHLDYQNRRSLRKEHARLLNELLSGEFHNIQYSLKQELETNRGLIRRFITDNPQVLNLLIDDSKRDRNKELQVLFAGFQKYVVSLFSGDTDIEILPNSQSIDQRVPISREQIENNFDIFRLNTSLLIMYVYKRFLLSKLGVRNELEINIADIERETQGISSRYRSKVVSLGKVHFCNRVLAKISSIFVNHFKEEARELQGEERDLKKGRVSLWENFLDKIIDRNPINGF